MIKSFAKMHLVLVQVLFFQSKKALPYLTNALRHLNDYLEHQTSIYDPERFFETFFVYVSTEIKPLYKWRIAAKLERPRVVIELGNILPLASSSCLAHEVIAKVN